MEEEIPQYVIEALEEVRASGQTNMFDYEAVRFYVETNWAFAAYGWLTQNKSRYVEALNAMGAARKAGA